jgi:hypothetical protein
MNNPVGQNCQRFDQLSIFLSLPPSSFEVGGRACTHRDTDQPAQQQLQSEGEKNNLLNYSLKKISVSNFSHFFLF